MQLLEHNPLQNLSHNGIASNYGTTRVAPGLKDGMKSMKQEMTKGFKAFKDEKDTYEHLDEADQSPRNLVAMIATIKSRLRGKAQNWATRQPAELFDMGDSELSLKYFLTTMTSKFEDPAAIAEKARKLYSVPSAGKTWTNFSIEFETRAQEAEVPLDDPSPLSAAVTALRTAIGPINRERADLKSVEHISKLGYEALCEVLTRSWKTTTVATTTTARAITRNPDPRRNLDYLAVRPPPPADDASHRAAHAVPLPFVPCKSMKQDDEPRIADNLRGKLSEKPELRQRLIDQDRCILCRRTRREHDAQALKAAIEAKLLPPSHA